MAADFLARLRFEGETINHGQQSQDGNQNKCNMEIRDAGSAARIAIEQRRKSQCDESKAYLKHEGEQKGRYADCDAEKGTSSNGDRKCFHLERNEVDDWSRC